MTQRQMIPEIQILAHVREQIDNLPAAHRQNTEMLAQHLRSLLAQFNDCATLAMALVGAEQAAKE
ncbi:MAG: hypothetical protein ACFNZS_01030 [Ottowia sp.]